MQAGSLGLAALEGAGSSAQGMRARFASSPPHSVPGAVILQCGSCWAFSGLAAIESKLLIATQTTAATNPIDLAEQQVGGCHGWRSLGRMQLKGRHGRRASARWFAAEWYASWLLHWQVEPRSQGTSTLAAVDPAEAPRACLQPWSGHQVPPQQPLCCVRRSLIAARPVRMAAPVAGCIKRTPTLPGVL